MSNPIPEQFASANKAAVDALLTVANTALASAERIAALNLNTARGALVDGAANAKTLMGVKDVQDLVATQQAIAQPAVEKAVAYGQNIYAITTEAQQSLAKMVEAQFADFQKSVAGLVAEAAKKAPAGSEVAVAAMQSAFAAANSAFDNMSKVAKQVSEMTEANIAATTSAAVKAVGAGSKKK
jgi:phasin family protein